MAGTEQCILTRDKAARLKRCARVAGLFVRHDCAGIVMRCEVFAHDLVKWKSVRAGNFNGSIQWLRDRDFGKVSGEVVRENGLKQRRG